jgi:hypothetical protein
MQCSSLLWRYRIDRSPSLPAPSSRAVERAVHVDQRGKRVRRHRAGVPRPARGVDRWPALACNDGKLRTVPSTRRSGGTWLHQAARFWLLRKRPWHADNGADMLIPSIAISVTSQAACCPIVEIRQYTLAPGSFQKFTTLFERYFVESQEADGMSIIGTFRVLDDPNRFFWIRGFASMEARERALTSFYEGSVWKAHRDAANSLLVENNNVLLLRPALSGPLFVYPTGRAPIGSQTEPSGVMVATIYSLGSADAMEFDKLFEQSIRPAVIKAGARVLAAFRTEHAKNNFPRLPIREDANVFVWLSCFQDLSSYNHYQEVLASDSQWAKILGTFAIWRIYSPPETWRLAATPRSALHC